MHSRREGKKEGKKEGRKEGRKERRNTEKVKDMIMEDRLDVAISKREELEMTSKFLMERLDNNGSFIRLDIHRYIERVRLTGKQSFQIYSS